MENVERKRVTPTNTGKTHTSMPLVNVRKTKRNEKCPCGSGKKFKACCFVEKSDKPAESEAIKKRKAK